MRAIDALRKEGLTRDFARLLVTELGEDAEAIKHNWCWDKLLSRYADLIPAAVTWFCKALKDEKGFYMRRRAAIALGHIGDTKAIPALTRALADDDDWVRWLVAIALGHIGDPKAIPALRKALKDEDAGVRQCAAEAMEECEKDAK